MIRGVVLLEVSNESEDVASSNDSFNETEFESRSRWRHRTKGWTFGMSERRKSDVGERRAMVGSSSSSRRAFSRGSRKSEGKLLGSLLGELVINFYFQED